KLASFIGDGARSDGFTEFVEFTESLRGMATDVDVETARLVRFMTAVSIACVETATQEHERDPAALADIVDAMCAGTAIAMTSAVLSVLRDDTPAAALREIVMAAFERGLDQTIKSNGLI